MASPGLDGLSSRGTDEFATGEHFSNAPNSADRFAAIRDTTRATSGDPSIAILSPKTE